jgi:head-tail adaptor
VPDGDGGYTDVPADLSPSTAYAEITPATARDLERLVAGTVESTDSLLVTMDYHPSVTTKTRLTWTDPAGLPHVASVTGVNNPDQRCRELILVAVEVVA